MKTQNRPARILVADDHLVVRLGLRELLKEALQNVEITEARNGTEAFERGIHENWDLAILDISMPGRNGTETIRDLHRAKKDMPIIVLSMHKEDVFALRSLHAGAWTYLTKDAPQEEIVRAVTEALAGRRHLTPDLASLLASRLSDDGSVPPHERLSNREHQVMEMIARGMSVSKIGHELSLSVKTISTHRRRMLDKLGLDNNAQVMLYAITHQIVPTDAA